MQTQFSPTREGRTLEITFYRGVKVNSGVKEEIMNNQQTTKVQFA